MPSLFVRMSAKKVILDTNFLMIPFQFKINIFGELDYLIDIPHVYLITSRTLNELRHIGKSIGKDGMAARLAIKMIEVNKAKIEIIKNDAVVDDWIVEYAQEHKAIVCTNDSGLRKRLRPLRVKVITLKSKSRLGYI